MINTEEEKIHNFMIIAWRNGIKILCGDAAEKLTDKEVDIVMEKEKHYTLNLSKDFIGTPIEIKGRVALVKREVSEIIKSKEIKP